MEKPHWTTCHCPLAVFASVIKLRRLLAILLLLSSQLACTATTLPPYEASYNTTLRGIQIEGKRKFEQLDGDRYRLSWRAKALWMKLDEWSEFKIVDGQVRPLRYHYSRKGIGRERPVQLDFDWNAATIHSRRGDSRQQIPLTAGTLDKLSYQIQMQLDLSRQVSQPQLHYRVADHRKIKDYHFVYQGQAPLETKLGEIDSSIYSREKANNETRIWPSPRPHHQPQRNEWRKGDKKSTATIKSWRSEP